jgi:hypothetical protein
LSSLPAAIAFVLVAAAGCGSPSAAVKDDFSRSHSCPKGRIEVRECRDIAPYDLTHNVATPPRDVAADPERLAAWQSNQQAYVDDENGHDGVFEARGCGTEQLYECRTSAGSSEMGNLDYGCVSYPYKPGMSKW